MREMRLLSWNVNGIRAVQRKGFADWFNREKPDVLCLQETKAHPDQLDDGVLSPPGYQVYWSYPAERRGYSGVALFTREKPKEVGYGLGDSKLDMEGRVIMARYPGFILFNIYYPNGSRSRERLDYKMAFYDDFLRYADRLKKAGERLVICGDFNTAHKEIDLARPKENAKKSGFLPEERAWIDKFIGHGYVDVFRQFHKEPDNYTYWDQKTRARERNVGWRIDYFFVNESFAPQVADAFIMPEVMGSDHCPIGLTLKLD